MKITRRKLALVLAAPAGLAQTQLAQTQPSADPQQAARDRIKANGEALSKEAVPMATEPAFQFKA